MDELRFETKVIHWRGPAPFFFAPIPDEHIDAVRAMARVASYGWGMVPVQVSIGDTDFDTSLYPKNGGYLLPLKDKIRAATGVTVDDVIAVVMAVRTSG